MNYFIHRFKWNIRHSLEVRVWKLHLELLLTDSGHVYITGGTWSSNFPTTAGTYNEIFNANIDVFVCKLSMLPKSH
ncbi:MAG: hypothetical protein HWN67_19900 [Candidatus Helarchaeota archaeon]|nr:hypothetical protein [Candidatus Helarchaeota archaeon]